MARLTEHELDLIQQNRRPQWRAWNDPIDLLLIARRFRASYLAEATGLKHLRETLSAAIVEPLVQGMRRRDTIRALDRLDDRMLRDIGLERAGIEAFAFNLAEVDRARPGHFSGLLARFRSWQQRRATIGALEALDDRLLNDIGLCRGEIRAAVAGGSARSMAPSVATSVKAAAGTQTAGALSQSPLGRLIARPFSALSHWLRRHRTISELRALDDRMLADIGLIRGQIPMVAAHMAAPPKAPSKVRAAEKPSHLGSAVLTMRRWNLSRLAASQMARLGPDTLSDLGYVKGDIDWVPEVLADRTLQAGRAAK